ncbi:MAG: DUF2155 domain-containing protein [Alphaproteobacteria bacterium]
MKKLLHSLPFVSLSLMALSGYSDNLDDIISEQGQEDTPPVIKQDIVVLNILNKISGRSERLNINVNETKKFKDLEISIYACQERPPEFVPESGAFLKVKETSSQKEIFSGWMFASAPSLSPFENTLYDVYVLDCLSDGEDMPSEKTTTTSSLESGKALTVPPPPPRPASISGSEEEEPFNEEPPPF